uniref:Zonadhesin n=1 Tax=Cacopsylla melanoneura TaxID=428564 RepID=A0A8D9FEM3_9HEMI
MPTLYFNSTPSLSTVVNDFVSMLQLTSSHSHHYLNSYSNHKCIPPGHVFQSKASPSLPFNQNGITETTYFDSINNIADEDIDSFDRTGSLHRFLSAGTARNIPSNMVPATLSNRFSYSGNTIPGENIQTLPREVIAKPIFIVQNQVETIQKPEFIVQDNVLGFIRKPEFLIQEIPEILQRPEFLVQEEVVGTIVKPTFLVQEQVVNVVQKPQFAIQEDVNVIVKPDFQLEEITEVVPKPTFVVEENVLPVQKPTFVVESSQEVIQKPDFVIAPVPVTIRKPEYQITENVIPVQKPAFLVQETPETVIRPEFVITEEVVPVPRPNFLVREEVQVIQRPSFLVQDVVETVQKPEYSVQDSTVVVQKPEFFIEDVTETVMKPSFVEQEVPVTVVSPQYLVQEQMIPVPKPQFVIADTVVPVVKPEFVIEEVQEVINKPEYMIEEVAIPVDKPTYLIEETQVVVQKPNFIIEEVVQTVPKPEYLIQEAVEIITKPEFIVQENVVETIIKPKFIVISASNPTGEVFDASKYKSSVPFTEDNGTVKNTLQGITVVSSAHSKQTVQNNPVTSIVYPGLPHIFKEEDNIPNMHHLTSPPVYSQKEPVVIAPSIKPQTIEGMEFSQPLHDNEFPSPPLKPYINHKTSPLNFQKKTVVITPSIKPNTIETIEEFSHPINGVQGPLHFEEIPPRVQNHSGLPKSAPKVKSDRVEVLSPHSSTTVAPRTLPRTLEVVEVDHKAAVPINDRVYYQNHRPISTSVKSLIDEDFLTIANKLGYQISSSTPNNFLQPHTKIKKNVDKSEEEELFETLNGIHDLIENGQYYSETGIPHPKYGYLFQDQFPGDTNFNETMIGDSNYEQDDRFIDYSGDSNY